MLRKWMMVEGKPGLLVAPHTGARGVVGQVLKPAKLDPKTQQLVHPEEHHQRYAPKAQVVPYCTHYMKAVRGGSLKQIGTVVVAKDPAEAAEKIKRAAATPTPKKTTTE